MSVSVSDYSERIRKLIESVQAGDLATYIEQVLSETPGILEEEVTDKAVVGLGDHRFHVSVLKLMSGLASVGKLLMDHSHPAIFVGLAVVAAISSLSESVRGISLDEAALCQAMYELKSGNSRQSFPQAQLIERFSNLVEQPTDLEKRYAAAIASLERLRIVRTGDIPGEVKLLDLIFIKMRPSRA